VLNREEPEQSGIDRQSVHEGHLHAGVNRLRNEEVPDEPYGVQKRSQEREIASNAVQESDYAIEHFVLLRHLSRKLDFAILLRQARLPNLRAWLFIPIGSRWLQVVRANWTDAYFPKRAVSVPNPSVMVSVFEDTPPPQSRITFLPGVSL